MSGTNLEPMSIVRKQALLISLAALVVFALIGLIPETNAYGKGWEEYWIGCAGFSLFIGAAFYLGTKLSRPKGYRE